MEEYNWTYPQLNTYITGSTSTKYKVIAFNDKYCLAANKTPAYVNFHMHNNPSFQFSSEEKENMKELGFTDKKTYWTARYEYNKILHCHVIVGGIVNGLYKFKWLMIDMGVLWN